LNVSSKAAGDPLARWGITVFERGWLSSNNVLLRGDEHHGAAIVDTGYCTHAEQTVALLRHALAGAPLTRILNTHLHSDHCGGNAALQAAFGCGIDIPAGEADAVAGWDEDALTYRDTGQQCPRFRFDGVLKVPGELVAGRWTWQLISSPGHDPKSLVLYQPEIEVLISADALWEDGFGVVFPELEGEAAFSDVGATLDVLSRLRVRHVIPGHGRPFTDMRGAIARARQRLERFVRDPRKHAWHAAKVLVKFRLLETQAESWADFLAWTERTRYFELVRERYFPGQAMPLWITTIVGEMSERGAIAVHNGMVENRA
jgi:glyoxylase-like metal-dependent hydrolase (beta-lactamase superfamily II)